MNLLALLTLPIYIAYKLARRGVRSIAIGIFLSSIKDKSLRIERMLSRFLTVSSDLEKRLEARKLLINARRPLREQQIRLAFRRGHRLYEDAVSRYTTYLNFEGPMKLTERLDFLTDVLVILSQAYSELREAQYMIEESI